MNPNLPAYKVIPLLHKKSLSALLAIGVLFGPAPVAQAATYLWNVPTPGVNDWNVNANWSPSTANPGATDTAIFGATGTAGDKLTVNNVVSVNTTVSALSFTNTTSGAWHVTQIPSGVTLSVTNLTVGFGTAVNSLVTSAAMFDAGTLAVYGSLSIGNNGSSSIDSGTILDLSALSNFVYNAGTFTLATGARSVANMNLAAASNSVTATTLNWNVASSSSSGSGTATLGAGTNILNAGAINIGAARSSCTVQFPAGAIAAGLRIRGVGGSDSDLATLTVGNHNNSGGSGSSCTGNLNFNGSALDLKLGTLTLGRDSNSSSTGSDTGTGNLNFDTGIVSATNILMAITTTANSGGHANGTINIGAAGTLSVGSGGISMANQNAGACVGNLNVNGGTVICAGNIFKTTAGGTANLTMTGGSLLLGGDATLGSATAPIDNFTISDATLALSAVNGGAGATVLNLNPGGTTNIINVVSIPGTTAFPAQFPLIAYSSLLGVANFGLGTLPGTYQGYLSNNTSSIDLVVTNSLVKSDFWRGNVSGNWDTTTLNWSYSGSPANYQEGDLVNFDDTLTGTPNVVLTTNVAPGSVSFNNSSHDYVLSGAFKITGLTSLIKQGSRTATLTGSGGDDFLGGIVVAAGTLILDNTNSAISGGLTINAGTAQIGNNDAGGALPAGAVTDNGSLVFNRADNLTVATVLGGTGTVTQNGPGTLTLTAAETYTGNTLINSSTLALTGSGTISNSALVTVSNGTLDVSAVRQNNLGGLNLSGAAINAAVNANGAPNIMTASLAFGAGANHLNVASLPPIASYPVTFTVIQSATPATGAFNMSLGTLPAATPPYAGSVSQSPDQTAVLLTITSGPIGVRQTVFWTGNDLANSTNWSDKLNWQLPGEPGAGENASFTSAASQSSSALSTPGGGTAALMPGSFNNLVDGDVTLASLTYSNLANSYHNTEIAANRTLTLTNGLLVGTLDTGISADKGFVTVSGGGSALAISGGNFQAWLGSGSVSGSQASLDVSALDTLNASVSRFLVGAAINNVVNRPSGMVYLAKTNTISAAFQTTTSEAGTTTANAALVVGDCNGNAGSQSFLYLGQVNTISADTIALARQKTRGQLIFNPIYANLAPYPTATFQGFSSNRVSIFDVGDGVGNTGTTTGTGDLNLVGGIATASIDTFNIGRASSGSGSGTTTGTVEFDAGTINANTVNVGLQPSAGTKVGIGVLGVASNSVIQAGAKLIVNGSLTIGGTPVGTVGSTTSGTLGITNGTVWAYAIAPGSGSHSSIILAGGQLIVTNAIGSASTPLETLTLSPLGTPDNLANSLRLPAGTSGPALTVTTLNLDALDTTTNVIGIESVGPVGNLPVELPLIQYGTMNFLSGATFNIGLGTLPAGYSGYLTNDTASSSIALVLTGAVNPQPMPIFSSITRTTPTTITFSGANGFANRSFTLLTSNDVTLPLSSWTVLGTGVYATDGSFSFSTSVNPAASAQFFRVQTQ